MTRRVVSVYDKRGYRTQILLDDHWDPLSGFKNWRLMRRKKEKVAKLSVFVKMLPLNRFSVIKTANERLAKWVILSWIRKQEACEILWISDPDYFDIHNFVPSKYLVFSCGQECLADRNRYIRYRECFEQGWVFGFRVRDDCQYWVFKKNSETEIVKKLLKKRG